MDTQYQRVILGSVLSLYQSPINYIYFNTELITIHDISLNKFNYMQEHYIEALKSRIKDPNQDINQIVIDNLVRLSKVEGKNE